MLNDDIFFHDNNCHINIFFILDIKYVLRASSRDWKRGEEMVKYVYYVKKTHFMGRKRGEAKKIKGS